MGHVGQWSMDKWPMATPKIEFAIARNYYRIPSIPWMEMQDLPPQDLKWPPRYVKERKWFDLLMEQQVEESIHVPVYQNKESIIQTLVKMLVEVTWPQVLD